jgi:flagellar biosynthesis protein FlhF
MKLKSYFSGTVEAAMDLARKELGEDALLVNARPATPETRSLGALEVVFGILPRETPQPEPAAPRAGPPTERISVDRLSSEVADLKREIERMARSAYGVHPLAMAAATQPGIYARLVECELDTELAEQVAHGTPLEDLFVVDAALGRSDASHAVVALVGPPGAGKTTTLVKLAARYGLTSRKPAHILSADVYRIAAADQLRTLASILGVGCTVVETPAALAQAIEEHRSKSLVLIDTPGLARSEMEDASDLASFISSHPEIDTHLVLPASMKPADMSQVIDHYEIFRPAKFLFTRMDETGCFGALISASARHARPISFLTAGQQIPDDLEPATTERLLGLVYGPAGPPPTEAASHHHSMGAAA